MAKNLPEISNPSPSIMLNIVNMTYVKKIIINRFLVGKFAFQKLSDGELLSVSVTISLTGTSLKMLVSIKKIRKTL